MYHFTIRHWYNPLVGIPYPLASFTQSMIEKQSRIVIPEIVAGDPNQPRIAMTFDDGPHPIYTDLLLDVLKRLRVRATFFVVGSRVKMYSGTVRRMILDGHEVGNHTYHHIRFSNLPRSEVLPEFDRTSRLLGLVTGGAPRLVRPPGGICTPEITRLIASRGYVNVLWTADPGDFKRNRTAREIEVFSLRDINAGGIILLHSGVQATIDALPRIVQRLRVQGYVLSTVSDLVLDGGVSLTKQSTFIKSLTRVHDYPEYIDMLTGMETQNVDYAEKLKLYQSDDTWLSLQRMLNRTIPR